MATAGRRDPATDEEFLAQLYKGGELLASGKVVEAKDHLERAWQLHPRNEKAQNLLGLTYFKLGIFDKASEIYEMLVNDNPVDPTLRVNLGLVYLKTNDLPRSVREFETATDLEPTHKKAHNYLGLALAQAGDYARAREHFVIAGSDAMAEKMAKAMVSATEVKAPQTVNLGGDAAEVPLAPIPAPPASAPAFVAAQTPLPQAPVSSVSATQTGVQDDAQIDVMSEEEVPPDEEPAPQADATTLMEKAQSSLGGADLPPPPQSGFEGSAQGNLVAASWGDQFGVEAAPAPAPMAAVKPQEDDMRMADDESPPVQLATPPSGDIGLQATVDSEAGFEGMPVIEAVVEEVQVDVPPPSAPPMPRQSAPALEPEMRVVPAQDSQWTATEAPLEAAPVVEATIEAPPAPDGGDWSNVAAQTAPQSDLPPPVDPSTEQNWSDVQPAAQPAAEGWAETPPAQSWDAQPEQQAEAAPQEQQWSDQPADAVPPAAEQLWDSAQAAPEELPQQQNYEQPQEQNYEQQPQQYEQQPQQYEAAPAEEAAPAQEQESSGPFPSWLSTGAPPPEAQPEAPAADPASGVPRLADLGPSLDYTQTPQSPAGGPFQITDQSLALTVSGELLTRLTGMVAVVGTVDAAPEMRRNRGRATDQGFGEGPTQLQRVKGHGVLHLEPGPGSYQAIDMDDEGAYLREERVFSFEESVAFENGRLVADALSVDLVHLKGHGRVLLKLESGQLKAIAVPPGMPLKVPLARLVGWYGRVTPRLIPFVGQGAVELTGEGYVLLAA